MSDHRATGIPRTHGGQDVVISDGSGPTEETRGRLSRLIPGPSVSRRDLQAMVGVVIASVAVFTPVFWRLSSNANVVVRGVNDFSAHYERVEAMNLAPFTLPVPHPVFHILVKIIETVLRPDVAMTVVMVAALVATTIVLFAIGRSRGIGGRALSARWAALFVVAAVVIESPAVLVSTGDAWWQRAPGFDVIGRGAGFLNAHVWGSPTITLSTPMYLAMVLLSIGAAYRDDFPWPQRVGFASLSTVACLTMPAAALGLVPAAALLMMLTNWPSGRAIPRSQVIIRMLWMLVPAVAVVTWQTWFLATSQSPLEEATWRFNPFWLVDYVSMDRPAFWALLLLIAAGFVLGGRDFVSDPAVAWVGTATVIAAFPMLFLQETGWKATHGGMAVSFGVCFGLLVTFTLRFMFARFEEAWRNRDRTMNRTVVLFAASFVLLCGIAGVLDLSAAIGVTREL